MIVAILGLGYSTYQYLNSRLTPFPIPPPFEDEISNLLITLEQDAGIDLLEIQQLEIKWIIEIAPEIKESVIKGKGFEAKGISDQQYEAIKSFLSKNGFEKDVYNIASGTVSELAGYKKERIVCIVIGGASGYKEATGQWIPPEPNKKDVDVKCGKISKEAA